LRVARLEAVRHTTGFLITYKPMLTTIAIAGRPNVGKSTLFNRLTHSRSALVSDFPGLTRDRQYGLATINDQKVIVIDSGGIGKAKSPIEILTAKQTDLAIKEAQIILFVLDGKNGLTHEDDALANKLRKLNKTIILVVNKTEGQNTETAIVDFHKLGFIPTLAISAEHNIGIKELIETIALKLPKTDEEIAQGSQQNGIKIAFVGRPNVGKSTLINRILGEERLVVHNQPGTTRDSICIDFIRHGQNYVLIDTAGVRRRSKIEEKVEKFSIIKTLQSIESCDVVVFLVDGAENITDQDLKLLGFVLETGKAIVIAVNKWDNLPDSKRVKIKNELDRRLTFVNFAKIHFISALHGTNVGNLFKSINKAYSSATRELSTPKLNKILETAVKEHQPPMAHNRDIKLRYAHAGHKAPPTIIIHGTRALLLPESYRRYLENFFRKTLDLSGTPVRIVFKDSRQ
jgi:GTPase